LKGHDFSHADATQRDREGHDFSPADTRPRDREGHDFSRAVRIAFAGNRFEVAQRLDGLHGAKIIGDIAALHSKILLDKPDVDLALPALRILIKEVKTI
jgi:hypothetical protein